MQAESQGVVLRFGKYLKTVEPGLRFKAPYGVDKVYVLPVRRQLKQEFGFATLGARNSNQFSEPRTRDREKSMVTGDLNAKLRWSGLFSTVSVIRDSIFLMYWTQKAPSDNAF